jgi:carbonic anhydrase
MAIPFRRGKADTRDTITLDKQTWTLQQFHFHAPSENTVHGKNYAMEMHLVHKTARRRRDRGGGDVR